MYNIHLYIHVHHNLHLTFLFSFLQRVFPSPTERRYINMYAYIIRNIACTYYIHVYMCTCTCMHVHILYKCTFVPVHRMDKKGGENDVIYPDIMFCVDGFEEVQSTSTCTCTCTCTVRKHERVHVYMYMYMHITYTCMYITFIVHVIT